MRFYLPSENLSAATALAAHALLHRGVSQYQTERDSSGLQETRCLSQHALGQQALTTTTGPVLASTTLRVLLGVSLRLLLGVLAASGQRAATTTTLSVLLGVLLRVLTRVCHYILHKDKKLIYEEESIFPFLRTSITNIESISRKLITTNNTER